MIVVTTPTGQIGSQVLHHLLATDEPLRVVVRDPSGLPDAVRDRVRVVEGSHGDPDVVTRAAAGADAVFWLTPPDPTADSLAAVYVNFARPGIEALREQGVARVVGVSALGRGTPWAGRAGNVTASLAVDDLFAAAVPGYRPLVMPSFMDNTARQTALIRDRGMFTSPIPGDRSMPMVATRDIAAVAARLLLDDSWGGFEEVPVLGPADLSFEEMTRTIADVLDRPVRFQQVSGDAFVERMVGTGTSPAMAQGLLDMAMAKAAGIDNAVARTPATATPTTFRQWCEDVLAPAVRA
jgi:uncharacterized protein YbjT (DUF2867 family)